MSAGRFVGRVGGLALFLGVGAAAVGGTAVAWGDTPAPDTGGATQSSSTSAGPSATGRRGTVTTVHRAAPAASRSAARPARAATTRTAPAAVSAIRARPAATALTVAPVTPAASDTPATPDTLPTPLTVQAAALEVARREAVQTTTTSSSLFGGNSITVNPTMVWNAGVLTGTLDATSTDKLNYVVIGRPSGGGKIGGGPLLPLSNFGLGGSFTYVPYADTLTDPTLNEKFRIMAVASSPLMQAVENLLGPLGSLLVPQVLAVIHRIPLVGDLLSPIIGDAKVVTFDINPSGLAESRPTAFTYKMPSFDGTLISVNYFPAVNVANGTAPDGTAPTVLAASGLACAANTDPNTVFGQLFPSQQFGSLTPGIKPLREDAFQPIKVGVDSYQGNVGGYNVITWDPRGEFASGGQLEIDNPMFEGRDVSEIISWLTSAANPAKNQVRTVAGDPLVRMTGGSYGGGIQLTTIDPRIDAIAPEIGWNSLLSALYPNNNQFKTGFGSILAAALFFTGARVNPAIYVGILTGVTLGWLSQSSQAVLGSVGPGPLLTKEQAPTFMFQGAQDTLFPLSQSVAAGQTITGNPFKPPYKLFWFCGGHGTCDIPNPPTSQDAKGLVQNLRWLDQYVGKDPTNPADEIPTFQWYDQKGEYHFAERLPWQDGFNTATPYSTSGKGGVLGLGPIIGGSGPAPLGDLPFSITNAGKAWNALNLNVTPEVGSQIVGAPTISFDYKGLGTSRTVYAQLVDKATGLVLGNNVTPIPVVLDGRTHTATMSMEDIAYTVGAGDSLTLQITSSAVNYENFTTLGVIDVSDIRLSLPIRQLN